MNIEVLISTMNISNEKEHNELIEMMNIKGKSVVINQCPVKSTKLKDVIKGKNRVFSYNEKGLSKSRNKAIEKCSSDIFLIADDDMIYVDNYEIIVNEAYNKYPDADIIAFYVASDNPNNIKPRLKEGKINLLTSFKLQSVQLSFKTNVIKNKKIKFDEKFGAGSEFFMGEENIFLTECVKSKLKIYSYPVEIAKLINRKSTWFNGYTKEYFQVKGACFSKISRYFWFFLFVQFAVRKRSEYKEKMTIRGALENMFLGRKKFLNNK